MWITAKHYLFSIAILTLGMGLGRFIYTGMMPMMFNERLFDFQALSYIASSNYLGYLFGASLFSFGVFHRPENLKISLIVSVISTVLLLYLMSITTSFMCVLIIRFLAGISSAAAIIFGSITVIKYFSSRLMTAAFFSGVGLGILVGNELVNILSFQQDSSLQIWFYAAILAAMIAGLIIGFYPQKTQSTISVSACESIAQAPVQPLQMPEISWISLIILYGFAGYGYIITATYLPVIAQSLPASPMTSHLWSLVGIGAMISCYLWLFIEQKIGTLSALFWNLLTQSLFVLLSVFSDSLLLLMISALGLGVTFMGTTSLVMPLARRLTVPKTLNLVGLVTLTYGIGQILGPIVTSVIETTTGSLLFATISAAAALLIASLMVLYEKRSRALASA